MQNLPVTALAIAPVLQAFGGGIATAQRALDDVSIRLARAMAGLDPAAYSQTADASAGTGGSAIPPVSFSSGRSYNLLELGFAPTFYRFTEAVMEMKVAVSVSLDVSQSVETSKSKARIDLVKRQVKIASVNGFYASRYQYSGESSSLLRSKVVSLPSPALLEARIAAMQAQERARVEAA